MSALIEDNSQDQDANGQSSRDWRVGSDARELETQAMEAIDSIGDFLRFVDGSIKSEILLRGFSHASVIKPRRVEPIPDCDRTNSTRRLWCRVLTIIFRTLALS
jgi:hypothetical protein